MQPTGRDLFGSALEARQQRGAGLGASLFLHAAGVTLLVALPVAKVEFLGERRSVLIAPLPERNVVELVAPRRARPKPTRPEVRAPAPAVRTGLLVDIPEAALREEPPRLSVRAGNFAEIRIADDQTPRVRTYRLDSFAAVGLVAENNDPPRPSPTSAGAAFGRATLGRRRELFTNGGATPAATSRRPGPPPR